MMIKQIIDLLSSDNFYNVSEEVEIAKGKYKMQTTWSGAFKQVKRIWKLRK